MSTFTKLSLHLVSILVTSLTLYGSFAGTSAQAAAIPLTFDRIEGGTLYFKGETEKGTVKPLKTSFYDLQFLKLLRSSEGGLPYVLFTGRPCDKCSAEQAVYLMRVDGSSKPLYFVHPGRVTDPKKKQLVLESRAFYGKCLSGMDEGYFSFQKERLDRKKQMQAGVFIAEVGKTLVDERLIERHAPQIKAVQPFLKARSCFELPGKNRMMLSKSLDLTPRRGQEGDDDETTPEDDETKENQTSQELPSAQD